ncbi:MAG: insulinase family protein [Caldithrix sp.]|nr:insulinase family protein [Caldithrix sp.]
MHIDFEQYYLNNGLRVILHEDRKAPVVAINIWYNVGSKHEEIGRTGFAHLFEHMMFQGSQHVPPDMHFQMIQSAGGTLNGSTFFDRTNFFEMLPSHFLEMGLWLEADRMGFFLPALNQDKFDRQREVVKNERRQRVDNVPYGTWFEKMLERAYPADFPYHWPVIGYMEDLDKAILEDVKQFFKMYYAPDNASLVVAGDITIEKTKKMIERYFASIPKGHNRPQKTFRFDGFNLGEKTTKVKDNVQLPRLYIGYHIPGFGRQQTYRADLLSDILSNGHSARLYRSLVYQKQLAQDAQAFILPLKETSLFLLVVTAKPDISLDVLHEEVQREIDQLRQGNINDHEIQRAKNQIEAQKLREKQSVTSKADNLNLYAVYFDNPALINSEFKFYESITKKELQKTAEDFLSIDNRIVLTFIPQNH